MEKTTNMNYVDFLKCNQFETVHDLVKEETF